MKKVVLFLLVILVSFPGWASDIRQVRDTLIVGGEKYILDNTPLSMLDSTEYKRLSDALAFHSAVDYLNYRWCFRGYVATWELSGRKLYLRCVKSIERDHPGRLEDVLKAYVDSSGGILASWYSGPLAYSSDTALWRSPGHSTQGWDDLFEKEIELTLRSGVVTSSRKRNNRAHDPMVDSKTLFDYLGREFGGFVIPELEGKRVMVSVSPSRYDRDGSVLGWSVKILKKPEGLDAAAEENIVSLVRRAFASYDWPTYCDDGRWFWINRDPEKDKVIWAVTNRPSGLTR